MESLFIHGEFHKICIWEAGNTYSEMESAPRWRTLSRTVVFAHDGSQKSATCQRTLSYVANFNQDGPVGLNDLLLVGGLCLMQWTSTIVASGQQCHKTSLDNKICAPFMTQ